MASVGADGFDGVIDLLHRLALADDFFGASHFGDGLAQAHIFFLGAFVGERLLHEMGDLVGIERLGNVIVSAVLERRHGGFHRSISGHHDHDEIGIHLVHAPLKLDPIGAAHLDIDQSGVPGVLGQPRQGAIGVFGGSDFISFFVEPFCQRIAHAQLVVHDQQF